MSHFTTHVITNLRRDKIIFPSACLWLICNNPWMSIYDLLSSKYFIKMPDKIGQQNAFHTKKYRLPFALTFAIFAILMNPALVNFYEHRSTYVCTTPRSLTSMSTLATLSFLWCQTVGCMMYVRHTTIIIVSIGWYTEEVIS